MRNVNMIFNVILSLAVIVLFVLFFNKKDSGKTSEQGSGKEEKKAEVKVSDISAPIVYVNSDSLFANYQFFIDNKKQSEKDRKSQDALMETKIAAFEKEVEDFKSKAQYMTQDQGMAKQQELMEKEQKLAQYRDQIAESLIKKEQDRNDSALKSVTDYLKEQYEKTGYSYILGYTAGGGILFSRDSLDITKEVVDGLNKRYKEGSKKAN